MDDTITAKDIIPLLDLTSLNETDDDETITNLCQRAQTKLGDVAAVCIYPQFVSLAKQQLKDTAIKIATVINFPNGEESVKKSSAKITKALDDGANEIDLVLPYRDFLAGKQDKVLSFIIDCHEACGSKTLKVILETGALGERNNILDASLLVMKGGADFIKTSTGKIKGSVTKETVVTILSAIHMEQPVLPQQVGIKISGGIRTYHQAVDYLTIISDSMGETWINPQTVRLGASQLLQDVLAHRHPAA